MEATRTQEAIERHLGLSIHHDPIHHYDLLGISPDASSTDIKDALKAAAARWNASDRKSNPESALLVANLLKQAQADLLDQNSRAKYDQSILALTAATTLSSHGAIDLFRAFEPAETPDSNDASTKLLSFGQPEERWKELKHFIPQLADASSEDNFLAQARGSTAPPSFSPSTAQPSHRPNSNGTQPTKSKELLRIEQLQRARKVKNRLYLSGIFAVAFLFLAFAGAKFWWNRQQVLRNAEIAKANIDPVSSGLKAIAKNADPVLDPAVDRQNTKLNAEKPNAEKPNTGKNEPIQSGLPSLSKDSSDSANANLGLGMSLGTETGMGSEPTTPEMTMPPAAPEPSAPEPNAPAPAVPTMSEMPASPEMPPMTEMPSMASMKDWNKAMKEARAAIDQVDFEKFHKQMEIAIPLSKTDELIAKQSRLDQLGQLYEIFINSMKDAKKKLRATEVLNVGKRKITIVETTEKELIIRVDGKNEKYAWDKMPLGIALALADLTLNDAGPTDLAARAVFCSLSPTKNELHEKRAKDFFEKSVGKGEIRADLPQALTDSYE
jgi:curved DNA-binding protein CbpA